MELNGATAREVRVMLARLRIKEIAAPPAIGAAYAKAREVDVMVKHPQGSHNELVSALGVTLVRKLYLQLLYRCNFNCRHCFHGEKLKSPEVLSPKTAIAIIDRFVVDHQICSVCLLGGEPLLYPHLAEVARHVHRSGLRLEICTNGFRREEALRSILPYTDLLRVSMDGDRHVHDQMRRVGSFDAALRTIALAREEEVPTGVTSTLTKTNVRTMPTMVRRLADMDVAEIVFHRLRSIGNAAANHLDDIDADDARWFDLHLLRDAPARPELKLDSDILSFFGRRADTMVVADDSIDRVEVSPHGEMYLSCKAVGSHQNSFTYDIASDRIVRLSRPYDELSLRIPQVVYVGHVT